ncbi:MAG: hypothetical protein V1866_01150 [archaeon]
MNMNKEKTNPDYRTRGKIGQDSTGTPIDVPTEDDIQLLKTVIDNKNIAATYPVQFNLFSRIVTYDMLLNEHGLVIGFIPMKKSDTPVLFNTDRFDFFAIPNASPDGWSSAKPLIKQGIMGTGADGENIAGTSLEGYLNIYGSSTVNFLMGDEILNRSYNHGISGILYSSKSFNDLLKARAEAGLTAQGSSQAIDSQLEERLKIISHAKGDRKPYANHTLTLKLLSREMELGVTVNRYGSVLEQIPLKDSPFTFNKAMGFFVIPEGVRNWKPFYDQVFMRDSIAYDSKDVRLITMQEAAKDSYERAGIRASTETHAQANRSLSETRVLYR